MLDIIADLLIDLIGGKPPQKSAQPRRRAQGAAGGTRPATPVPSQRDERLEQERLENERQEYERLERERRASAPGPMPRTMTLEDVVRRLSGEEAPQPQVAPAPKPQPATYSRPVRTRNAAPDERSLVAKTLDALPEEALYSSRRDAHRYVTALRSNPKAAQDALVYGEIFGRPMAERENQW